MKRFNGRVREVLFSAILVSALQAVAADVKDLRLVPFPKEVSATEGDFDLSRPLMLHAPAESIQLIRNLLALELQRIGLKAPSVAQSDNSASVMMLTVAEPAADLAHANREALSAKTLLREKAKEEEYALVVDKARIRCASADGKGLLHGVQTLCQLIRANRTGQSIPCLSIRDWPALKWRGFQNDMTRGPSSTLQLLREQVDLSSYLKLNLFSYYMEYQFAYSKHPEIGPADGSFTPSELKALVGYAAQHAIEIMGNQQSFGHMADVLKLPQYRHLAEASWCLSPACEETYQLIDDLWSDQMAGLPFNMFNVCCDEVSGLGMGPAKEMVAKLGTAEVYVRHVLRLHRMLKENYNKRMLMWGDIILNHPDKLEKIPKDVVMMTWNYCRSDNFDANIKPFAKSGYDFFVCPGVSDWNRILPDFDCATTNIYYFVRDGLKYGAIGMLNTEWKDDCETLNATMVHGVAWGAECAWGGSATSAETFNRRIGAVLFGERGDHFGKAVELLGRTYGIKGVANGSGIPTSRFYANDFSPELGLDATRKAAQELLGFVRPAIVHLEACRQDAVVNAGLLDGFILGARRMELIGQRMLDAADALEAYIRAYEGEAGQGHAALVQLSAAIRKNGELRQSMFVRFAELWARENKPYALSRVEQRYAAARQTDEVVLAKLGDAEKAVASGKGLPPLARLGLGTEGVSRHTWPDHEVEAPMMPAVAWKVPTATHRLGLGVHAGPAARQTLPIEQDLALPQHLRAQSVRAFCSIEGGTWQEIPVQLNPVGKTPRTRLTLVIQEMIQAKGAANIYVYFGLAEKPKDVPQAVRVSDAREGMKVLENDRVRVWLGSEGGHLYRWEVKALEGRDLTQPGETGWSGFSDIIGELRAAQAKLTCLGSGPAVVRFRCAYPSGETKQISLFAGASWTEEMLSGVEGGYTDYDDPQNFAADGPMPGHYLFSGGESGPVGKHADGRAAQVYIPAIWSIKFNDRKMALGLVTPEGKTSHLIGPGGGWGGVGVNGKPPVHVVTFAGMLEAEPEVTMKRLQQTLNLKKQPEITLFGLEQRN